ncbi:Xaa-Pro peptidase family protein [Roseiflexus sp.]|uniref:M24 family metallopeptidase n=1 Tax=Roseiflexus sp. TaxID=2562120 RepID=UPI0021DE140C|nr:Xaa-Pro peptidase family protein [Roseiflexus sp.]GIV98887.1 MAG: peptidase M24 [Roseiflexus sp.]
MAQVTLPSPRIPRIQAALRRHGFDALAVVPGSNLRYLAGLTFHAGLRLTVMVTPVEGQPALVVPGLEYGRVAETTGAVFRSYPWGDDEGPGNALMRAVRDTGLGQGSVVGIEHTVMRVFELRALEQALPGAQFVDATPLLAELRMVKDAAELEAMRVAVQVIEATLHQTLTQVRAGMRERDIADLWERAIRAAGCQPAFETTVASGPNSANPHHTSGDRALQDGDMVVFDGGAVYQGYVSDITRTCVVGHPSDEMRRVYNLVLAANAAGRDAAAQPGATGASIDAAARQIIERGGYGPFFIHRTGHGIGLDVHEPPFIVAGSQAPLPIGATFTVEPGIYLRGIGGVRIEDDVVITADGAESLTTFPREIHSIS